MSSLMASTTTFRKLLESNLVGVGSMLLHQTPTLENFHDLLIICVYNCISSIFTIGVLNLHMYLWVIWNYASFTDMTSLTLLLCLTLLASWFASPWTFRASLSHLAVSPFLTSWEIILFSCASFSHSDTTWLMVDSRGSSFQPLVAPIWEYVVYGPMHSLISTTTTHDLLCNN